MSHADSTDLAHGLARGVVNLALLAGQPSDGLRHVRHLAIARLLFLDLELGPAIADVLDAHGRSVRSSERGEAGYYGRVAVAGIELDARPLVGHSFPRLLEFARGVLAIVNVAERSRIQDIGRRHAIETR